MSFALLPTNVRDGVIIHVGHVAYKNGLANLSIEPLIQQLLEHRCAITTKLASAYLCANANTDDGDYDATAPQYAEEMIRKYTPALKYAYTQGYIQKIQMLAQILKPVLEDTHCMVFHDLLAELVGLERWEYRTNKAVSEANNAESRLAALRIAVISRQNQQNNNQRHLYNTTVNTVVSKSAIMDMLDWIIAMCEYGQRYSKSEDIPGQDLIGSQYRCALLILDILNRCCSGYYRPVISNTVTAEAFKCFASNLLGSMERHNKLTRNLGSSSLCCVSTPANNNTTDDLELSVVIMTSNLYDLACYAVQRFSIDKPGVQSVLRWCAVMRGAVKHAACENKTVNA